MIRLRIARKTNDQASGRAEEFTVRVSGTYQTCPCPVTPDSIEDLVRGGLVISLPYIDPKAVEGE